MKPKKTWEIRARIWVLAAGLIVGLIRARAESIVVLENPVLIVDAVSNAATNWLYLQNTSNLPVDVRLSATDFTNTVTGKPLGAGVGFGSGSNDNWAPVAQTHGLASNGTWAVRVRATNVWEAGESKAMLSVNGVPLAALVAAHWRAPFGVSLAGAAAPTNELAFVCGRPMSLVLSNADPMTYEVQWELSVGGITVTNGQVLLLPSSQATAGCVSRKQIFRGLPFSIKDRSQDAQLTLRWPPSHPGGVSPREKVIAFRFGSAGSVAAQYVLIVLFLLAGVVGSWALHITLPNLRRRADLGTQLDRLAERTRNLSSHIDSSLRVLLRVQRRRLLSALEGGSTWSPETSNALDEAKTNIGTLDHQLALVERMDRVYDRLAGLGVPPVPSALRGIETGLEQASRVLRATTPTPEDLQSADTLMKDTESRLAKLGQDDDALAALIAQRIKTVGKQLTSQLLKGPGGEQVCKRLPALLGLPAAAQPAAGQPVVAQPVVAQPVVAQPVVAQPVVAQPVVAQPVVAQPVVAQPVVAQPVVAPAAVGQKVFDTTLEDPKNITRDLYQQLDVKSRKLELVVLYLQVLSNLSDEGKRGKTMGERGNKLMECLELEGYDALRRADRLVREMQQGIYPEGIEKELDPSVSSDVPEPQPGAGHKRPPQVLTAPEPRATIELDQPVAYPNAPALHRLVFRKVEMNDAVARDEFSYEWSFGSQRALGRLARIKRFLALEREKETKVAFGEQYVEPGQSWSLWHFYPQPGQHEIRLTIRLTEGKPVAVLTRMIEVKVLPKSHWLKERTVVEVVQTGVALLAPMLALISGAREKLLQQDLFMAVVAIFLMGFTADAIKNLLVQGSAPSPGKPNA